jgi:hypothetical protein
MSGEPAAQPGRLTEVTKTRPVGPNLLRLLPVAAVLLIVSCGTNPAAPAATATPAPATPTAVVFGVIKAVPACPADRVAHACSPHPLADVRVEADSAGTQVISSSVTGADGRYSLQLGPGRYVLRAPVSLRCRPVPVTVPPGAAIRVDLTCPVSQASVPPDSAA